MVAAVDKVLDKDKPMKNGDNLNLNLKDLPTKFGPDNK
jgi:hypothetical protein